jgi:phosphatidylglycerol phospholipase C
MPRLVDLLEYLNQPEAEHTWIMLDIKRDDDVNEMLRNVALAIESVPPVSKAWNQRILLCCWNAKYISLCNKYLPTFRIAHVGWSIVYASYLKKLPNISFSMLHYSLASPLGRFFMHDLRRDGTPLFVWTVNEEDWMVWSIRRGLDGVITDDPKLFLEVCDRERHPKSGDAAAATTASSAVAGFASGTRALVRRVRYCGAILLYEFLHLVWVVTFIFKHGTPRAAIRSELAE